jgi:hypothetical protein
VIANDREEAIDHGLDLRQEADFGRSVGPFSDPAGRPSLLAAGERLTNTA